MNSTLRNSEIKGKLREVIKELVDSGKIPEAKHLIHEYRKVYPNSIEIFSIEAVIALMEGDLSGAEQVLRMGLVLDGNNSDLLFNFAYLCEMKGLFADAIDNYLRARENADDELKHKIDEIIVNIKKIKIGLLHNTGESLSIINPKVSVVIPTYNMKEYLKETIDSILIQDFEDIEIIVGDDCSSDGTDEMMKQYKFNSKIRYIRNEINLGAKVNCQSLLYEHVRGKYVLGINHDDYLIKHDYISQAVIFLEENPSVSLVFANVKQLIMETGQISTPTIDIQKVTNGIEYFLNYQTNNYPHIPSTLTSIYRIEDAKRMGCLLEETLSQDTFLYLKLMLIGDIGFIHDHVGVYRVHEKSLSFNMPLDKDVPTIEEFERLHCFGVTKGLDVEQMERWLLQRVYQYVLWRFFAIWRINRKSALELLMGLSNRYLEVYDQIISNLQWVNKR
ncbi:glycosyltransferase involved in cell wall biosynthesis [Paenibacillus sp. DS2015]|uniref:glycosyltransferase n=1 Tax=Paenibacillus sp. DS2015 TaxID=3373917 RepID=UPI003D1DE228